MSSPGSPEVVYPVTCGILYISYILHRCIFLIPYQRNFTALPLTYRGDADLSLSLYAVRFMFLVDLVPGWRLVVDVLFRARVE